MLEHDKEKERGGWEIPENFVSHSHSPASDLLVYLKLKGSSLHNCGGSTQEIE